MANQQVFGCYFLEAFAAYKGGGCRASSIYNVLSKWGDIPNDELTNSIQSKDHTIHKDDVFSTKLLDEWLG
jgi:hypothetical protein